MKNLKKLSLEDGINREAEEIEKKVKENKEIEGMTVSEDMETALFNKIQEFKCNPMFVYEVSFEELGNV